MGSDDEETTRLTKKLRIDDHDLREDVESAFSEHWKPKNTATLPANLQVIGTDLACDGETVLCGHKNGTWSLLDPNLLIDWIPTLTSCPKHSGLSCVRSSKSNPKLVFTSGTTDGNVFMWDAREASKAPVQKFIIGTSKIGGGGSSSSKGGSSSPVTKPVLQFDISLNDQLICAGTELVGEDSYLLFWDIRSSKLLGAYWESHSDDVTSVCFHPSKTHSLTTGSTDGLINVFNLLEPSEDDALLFSWNTDSSVDKLQWNSSSESSDIESGVEAGKIPKSAISCITHTNELQLLDGDSGDHFVTFSRNQIAQAMLRSNEDAVYLNGFYGPTSSRGIKVLTSSLAGSCSRVLEIVDNQLRPSSLFLDQPAVIQAAQYLPKLNLWLTFDDDSHAKVWSLDELHPGKLTIKAGAHRVSKHRQKPYSRENYKKIR